MRRPGRMGADVGPTLPNSFTFAWQTHCKRSSMALRAAGPQWRRCLRAAAQQRQQFSGSALASRVSGRPWLGAGLGAGGPTKAG